MYLFNKTLKSVFTLVGMITGFLIGISCLNFRFFNYFNGSTGMKLLFLVLITLLFGLILFLISPIIIRVVTNLMNYLEHYFQKIPTNEIIVAAFGAIITLIISTLIVSQFSHSSIIWMIIAVLIDIFMAALGAKIAILKKDDIFSIFTSMKKMNSGKERKSKSNQKSDIKILDTSVIIDGRIFDICQTGFVEGSLMIPNFVLQELRHIADSSDTLKRNRGRRGLDILNKIQNELSIDVQIYEKDFPDINEVDSKLLKLAQIFNGKVLTNDYNLNKVAEFQGVAVLNINELANAIKPVVLPGEEMKIQVVKDGKESGQGLAYLDDGTMIVVEGGRKHIGETLDVLVTSVLQTAAGRMIFARQKDLLDKAN